MASKGKVGDSEFGGGGGLIQQRNIDNGHLTGIEEVWSVYATDPESTNAPDPRRVGLPDSYARLEPARSDVFDERDVPGALDVI